MTDYSVPEGAVQTAAITVMAYIAPSGETGVAVKSSEMTIDNAFGLLEAAKFWLWHTAHDAEEITAEGDE
jgi:hypothetical protein